MASFDIAYRFMLANEDKTPPVYAEVPDAPPGAHAISGINSAAWPLRYPLIAAIPQAERGPAVEAFYEEHYWNQWYAQLVSDDLCKRVFDASVNMGSVASVRCLQEAVNWIGDPGLPRLVCDGKWGTNTVEQVNACGPALVSRFQKNRVAHYQAIVAANLADAQYLASWTERAEK